MAAGDELLAQECLLCLEPLAELRDQRHPLACQRRGMEAVPVAVAGLHLPDPKLMDVAVVANLACGQARDAGVT